MSDDRIGQQFGNYRLTRLLGEGGFAKVYLGEHIHLSSQVAVKLLHTKLISDEQEAFLAEARTIATLDHPSIVRVLDCGIERGESFLIMNYAPNGTLRQRYPKGTRMSMSMILKYTRQVAEALQYAHDRKLIHRDVKPENMLLGSNDELLLSDFGIALVSSSSLSQSTKAATGTVSYMAPEQILGKPRIASDQYALGIVIYEWLCGELPFHGSFAEVFAQHLYAPPPSLLEKVPTISLDVEAVVMKALAKEPSERFATIQDFAEALQDCDEDTAPALRAIETVRASSENVAQAPAVSQDLALVITSPLVPPLPESLVPVSLETPIPATLEPEVEISEVHAKTEEPGKNALVTGPIPLVSSLAPTVRPRRPRKKLFVIVSSLLLLLLLILPLLLHYNQVLPSLLTIVHIGPPSVTPYHPKKPQPTPTPTPTPVPTPTPTPTPVPTPTPTPQPTPTPTPIPPSACISLPSEAHCTSQDPLGQGCDADAQTVSGGPYYIKDSNGNNIGEVQLRYSKACKSNWARIVIYQSCGHSDIYVQVSRPDQTYQGQEYIAQTESYPYTVSNPGCVPKNSVVTNMVYTPGTVKAQACGTIDGSAESCTKLV